MKKIIPFILVLLLSCSQYADKNVEHKKTNYKISDINTPLVVVQIDGCEYLFGEWGNATVLTHKGDCKNSIHPEHLRR